MQLETERLILRPWRVSDAESLYKVMLHCGFHDCNRETHCPNLQSGADKTVRVMKLSKVK